VIPRSTVVTLVCEKRTPLSESTTENSCGRLTLHCKKMIRSRRDSKAMTWPHNVGLIAAVILALFDAIAALSTTTILPNDENTTTMPTTTSFSPADTPTSGASTPQTTEAPLHQGASSVVLALMFVAVGLTYYLVIAMSHRAVSGEDALLPHVDRISRLCHGTGFPGVGNLPRRYSTLSFDDDDADENTSMHPHPGATVDPRALFARRERAAAGALQQTGPVM
jgi:hypothetical protein